MSSFGTLAMTESERALLFGLNAVAPPPAKVEYPNGDWLKINDECPAVPVPLPTPHEPEIICCGSHTQQAFNVQTMKPMVDWAAQVITEIKPDAILVCGHSGLLVSGALSYLTGVPTIAVRKEGEPTVSIHRPLSGVLHRPAERWVWLDDLIASGGTMRHAVKTAKSCRMITSTKPLAMLLYYDRGPKKTKRTMYNWHEVEKGATTNYDLNVTTYYYRRNDY
jgi:adenine/guanine phosphoribosyltransferase-like PRPP-binding protein